MTLKPQGLIARMLSGTACLLVASGCSSFETSWRQAAAESAPTNSLVGRWEGSWRSEATGHHDSLRCLITPVAETNSLYLARFHARYKMLFPLTFSYSVVLTVMPDGDNQRCEGEANLGWWAGGNYRYTGTNTATQFSCIYTCKYDHGTFQMNRAPSP